MRIPKKLILKMPYNLAKYLYFTQLFFENFNKEEIIFVYQMGKVGSSTIVKTLRTSNLGIPVFNIHTLEKFFHDRTEKIFKPLFRLNKELPITLWEQQYFRNNLNRYLKRKKIKIITLVRDPIARNVSLFFQHPNMIVSLENNGYRIKSKRFKYDRFIATNDIFTLRKLFLEKLDNHERPLQWLDMELKKFFNIDLYASDFPKIMGYKIYNNGSVSALALKTEKLDETFQVTLSKFLNIELKQLHNTNIGAEKKTADLYKQFKSFIKLPEDYVNRFYNSKFVKHFYTDIEIGEFKARWI